MELKRQVVNKKLSEELKKNGYPQKGLWWWNIDTAYKRARIVAKPIGDWAEFNIIKHHIVAPTVAELGEELRKIPGKECSTEEMLAWKGYKSDIEFEIAKGTMTEADGRAKMWLYLKR